MRPVYRNEDNKLYWDRRWSELGSDPDGFAHLDTYPIKYAELVCRPGERILELGCGLGRVLKHYDSLGYDITGLERSDVAIERLQSERSDLAVVPGDVLDLPFDAGSFDTVLAFGVYHNLEQSIQQALVETSRVLRPDGSFCISVRPDNVEMRLNEAYWRSRQGTTSEKRRFHKMLFRPSEFRHLLAEASLHTTHTYFAQNVSNLYRVPWLRARGGNEMDKRAGGYRLNLLGRALLTVTRRAFPFQTSNVMVFIGRKQAI